jgi:hypothetical protein
VATIAHVGRLREELEERDAADIAAMLEGDRPDDALAAMWRAVLDRRDPVEIVGHAVLWCTRPVLAGAVAECVRLVVDRARRKLQPRLAAVLDLLDRHAAGTATLEDVWDERSEVDPLVEDAPSTAVLQALEAAGDRTIGVDDEALNSAGEAVMRVIAIAGEPARDTVIAILARRLPPPTVAAFDAAYAWRSVAR